MAGDRSQAHVIAEISAAVWMDEHLESVVNSDLESAIQMLSDRLGYGVEAVRSALPSLEASPFSVISATNPYPVPGTASGPTCQTAACPAETFVPRCTTTSSCPTLTTPAPEPTGPAA